LSADFRIRDIPLWEKWYGQKHGSPELVGEAVYGLAEVNRAGHKKCAAGGVCRLLPDSGATRLFALAGSGLGKN
jgi:hypothetical protein